VLVRRFRVPLAEIGYIRMIVEAYDGLAVVVTPGGANHEVIEWWIAPGREAEADTLARALAGETRLQELG
jgi:hypothetical protein